MKRSIIIILLFCMFCTIVACQPTPEHEIVINKGDGVVERKLNATPKPAAAAEEEIRAEEKTGDVSAEPEPETQPHLAPQTFPERWDADAEQMNERLSVAAHADVLQRADGLYPVYRTHDSAVTAEQASALTEALLPKPKDVFTQEPTKEDYKRELQNYLDMIAEKKAWVDAGMPDDGVDRDTYIPTQEEIDTQTAVLMERIEKAPDKLEKTPVSDYSVLRKNLPATYTLEDGGLATVLWYDDYIQVSKGQNPIDYDLNQYMEDKADGEPRSRLWKDPTMDRADAEKKLFIELEKLGFSGVAVTGAIEANLFGGADEDLECYTSGWLFTLKRDYGGYPSVSVPYEPSQLLQYSTGRDFQVSAYIRPEEIRVLIDENGVQYFGYSSPKEIVKLMNESVELLPFAEVQRITKNTLSMCFPYEMMSQSPNQKFELEIYRMLLTTYTLRVPDSDDYYEMPCWVIFFDGIWNQDPDVRERMRAKEDLMHDALVLNAIDGSVVHTDYGY